jgi:hypothetical protein
MLAFLPTPSEMTKLFDLFKQFYPFESISPERKTHLLALVTRYGYLPWSHQQALEELSAAETLLVVEEKLRLNGTFTSGGFAFSSETISPVSRAGYVDSSWIKKEGHEIKLLNLAALGNGKASAEPGRLLDWLRQLAILPAGDLKRGILATTLYLLPFHPRDFGCAYIPRSSEVSPLLEDALVKEKMGLDANGQMRFFLTLAQLAGHPLLYDVLPQTGRFSALVLSNPWLVRWFDIPALVTSLDIAAAEMGFAAAAGDLRGQGTTVDMPEQFRVSWLEAKQKLSAQMATFESQTAIAQRVKEMVCEIIQRSPMESLTETDVLEKQDEITAHLINAGLWPAPGGAWCSAGAPVFDRLMANSNTPIFLHFDKNGRDVTRFANLDCLAPYYFVHFERREYNEPVIAFWVEYLKGLRATYNFDGYRFDHVDHVVDDVSVSGGFPISYRAPARALEQANAALQNELPHYASLAEYMLWDNLLVNYHQEMGFDLLWGTDMISQYEKDIAQIERDNLQLEQCNAKTPENSRLSILKTYNNQDGEYEAINQYPAQLGENGALFKWFKLKFTPGGEKAARPVMYMDGDESLTPRGTQHVISVETSLTRERNDEFHRRFDALRRLALELISDESRFKILLSHPSGLASWMILPTPTHPGLWMVADEKAPTEWMFDENHNGCHVERGPLYDIHLPAPEGFQPVAEWVLEPSALDYSQHVPIHNLWDNWIHFNIIQPAQFHIYRLEAVGHA